MSAAPATRMQCLYESPVLDNQSDLKAERAQFTPPKRCFLLLKSCHRNGTPETPSVWVSKGLLCIRDAKVCPGMRWESEVVAKSWQARIILDRHPPRLRRVQNPAYQDSGIFPLT
jgi:hypothetical protein